MDEEKEEERPRGVPPPIRVIPGYGTWTCLVAATCAFAIVFGLYWLQITAPVLVVTAGMTWWIRKHTRSILAVILDIVAVPIFVILWVEIVKLVLQFVGLEWVD